jgi:hypothetical protein
MATLAMRRETVSNSIVTLERLGVGSTTIMNGLTIRREGEESFHLQLPDEAVFGSARNVAEWMELVKKKM